MDKRKYHSILQYHAIPCGKEVIGSNFIFQQNNDPKHTSKLCKNYLQNKEKENQLRIMEWPAQSPNCNPIELLWDHLDRQIWKSKIMNSNDLWEIVIKERESISSEVLNNLLQRMPRIC